MRYKTMKKSGEKISAITVGTWAIGGKNSMGGGYGEIDDQDSIEAIKAMIDGGVNLIDTAPIYGEGHSEEVVGKAIEGIRDKVLIATKYGSYIENGKGVHCSRPDSVLREFDASLKRLNTDYVDMYLMHWPDDLGTPIEDTMACVNKLKEQGAVRMLGLCNVDIDYIAQASEYADIDIVKSNIALTELRAPFDGVIGLRNVSEGAYASPSVVVAKLTKIKPLKIDLSVPERYASQIKPGTRLTFTVEGYNETFHAEVYATESKIDPNTHYFSVRAHYPNTRGRLLPGRFVSVKIRMHDIPDAIAIPTEAIVPEMGVDKVYLYKGGKARAVTVRTGLRTDSSIQIIAGLNVGDTIITSGTLQLRTDLPVKLDTVE